MKKILGISLLAIVVSAPALADPDYKSAPVTAANQNDTNLVTNQKRKYALVDETANNNIATTSYVKGAYNATMKAINSLDFATKEGVVASINKSTAQGDVIVYNTWGQEDEDHMGTATVNSVVMAPGDNNDTYHETYSGNARGAAYPQYTDTAGTRVFADQGNDVKAAPTPGTGN